MTKKSAGRIMRDAQKAQAEKNLKDNTCWDDLNGTYQGCVEMLQKHASIAGLASDKVLLSYIPDHATLITNIRSLGADLQAMNGELMQIRAQHAGKTGGSTDPDEIIRTFEIFEQYNLFMTRHDAVVMPTVYQILEQFDQAEKAAAAAVAAASQSSAEQLAQQQASDPAHTDPIDVQFTELATTSAAE